MGGAFTAVADDENAMFYNPAGLNRIEGFGRAEILNPYLELSRDTLDFFGDLREVGDAENDTEQSRLAADLLDKWFGKRLHLRTGLFPNVTLHNFGIGVLGQGRFDGEVHNPLGSSTLEVRAGTDIAAIVSGAYGFLDQRIQVGLTGKFVSRRLLEKAYTTRELVAEDGIDFDDLEEGKGFGVDLGAIYNLPAVWDPSVGFAILNLADLNLGDAGKLEQQINLGAALRPPVVFGKLLLALDVMDVTNQLGKDSDLGKRIHAGVEYRFPIILALRTGLHQGYPSFGLTADFWIAKLGYAYSIEEVGAFAGQRPDRRHIAQLSLGF